MSQAQPSNLFDFGKIDWDAYESHRPTYPNALYDIILAHHKNHGGSLNTALDVGAGGGTVAKVLFQHFKHVVCSDAAAGYVSQLEQRFAQEGNTGRATFLQRKFGEFKRESDLPGGQSVDLITAGTCIHFGDASVLTTQFANVVRPGGTFAAFCYGGMPILPPNDPAQKYLIEIKDKMLRQMAEQVKERGLVFPNVGPGTIQARYDNVVFDPSLWTDVRRIKSLLHERLWPEWVEASPSQVRADVEKEEIVRDDFFAQTVDYDFFVGYFKNLVPGHDFSELVKGDLQELKAVLGDRKVLTKWPAILVLATRTISV